MTDELIKKLEAATGPDRELDAEIDAVVSEGTGHPRYTPVGCSLFINPPHFTSSIDAAMTLVPTNHEWSVGWGGNSIAEITALPDGPSYKGYSYFPAIAICIAAIKARDSHVADLTAENERLREVLEPLVESLDNSNGDEPDRSEIWESPVAMGITFGELRKARAALKGNKP